MGGTIVTEGFISTFENAVRFNQDLDNWAPGSNLYFDKMFKGASQFNGKMFTATTGGSSSIGVKMVNMFENAVSFTGKNINDLQTQTVTSMYSMFKGATVFNSPCAHSTTSKTTVWNVAAVTDLGSMFEEARSFNQSIETWTLAGATLIAFGAQVNSVNTVGGLMSMFKNAAVFNNGIFTLDTANTQPAGSRDLTSM